MKNGFLLCFIFCLYSTYSFSQDRSINEISWLIGSWQTEINGNTIYEDWVQKEDDVLEGISFSIAENDTLFHEKIKITVEGPTMVFIPSVFGQEDAQSSVLELAEISANKFVFQNLEHGSPNIIFRQALTDSSIKTTVTTIADRKKTVEYEMLRIK